MTSVPPIRFHDDDGDWHDLVAALSVAYAALTDARALAEQIEAPGRLDGKPGLRLSQALRIMTTMLDAYLDAPAAEGER